MTHEPPLKSTAQLEIKVVFHIGGVVLAGDTSKMRDVIGARGGSRSQRKRGEREGEINEKKGETLLSRTIFQLR